ETSWSHSLRWGFGTRPGEPLAPTFFVPDQPPPPAGVTTPDGEGVSLAQRQIPGGKRPSPFTIAAWIFSYQFGAEKFHQFFTQFFPDLMAKGCSVSGGATDCASGGRDVARRRSRRD